MTKRETALATIFILAAFAALVAGIISLLPPVEFDDSDLDHNVGVAYTPK